MDFKFLLIGFFIAHNYYIYRSNIAMVNYQKLQWLITKSFNDSFKQLQMFIQTSCNDSFKQLQMFIQTIALIHLNGCNDSLKFLVKHYL